MKTLFIFCILSLGIHKIYSNQNIIIWSDTLKLDWLNFTGNPVNTIQWSAISACQINFEWLVQKDSIIFSVVSEFNKSKSWVKPYAKTKEVLKHEQGHFDLTEVYSRKLRMHLKGLNIPNMDNIETLFDSIFNSNYNELLIAQETYDLETDYSNNSENQIKWDQNIRTELDSLIEFSNSSVTLALKIN